MTLPDAQKLSAHIAGHLAPFCERIEIAGSIRRGCPECGDIDLVILPRNLAGLQARLTQNPSTRLITDGPINKILKLGNGVQLDIFLARPKFRDLLDEKPTNFGSLFLCRTGSKEHNIHLVEHAKKIGLRWNPYEGVFDEQGFCIAGETEESIFEALGLDYVEPSQRSISFPVPIRENP